MATAQVEIANLLLEIDRYRSVLDEVLDFSLGGLCVADRDSAASVVSYVDDRACQLNVLKHKVHHVLKRHEGKPPVVVDENAAPIARHLIALASTFHLNPQQMGGFDYGRKKCREWGHVQEQLRAYIENTEPIKVVRQLKGETLHVELRRNHDVVKLNPAYDFAMDLDGVVILRKRPEELWREALVNRNTE